MLVSTAGGNGNNGRARASAASKVLVLPAGETKLLPFWDEDACTLDRDWRRMGHERCASS